MCERFLSLFDCSESIVRDEGVFREVGSGGENAGGCQRESAGVSTDLEIVTIGLSSVSGWGWENCVYGGESWSYCARCTV